MFGTPRTSAPAGGGLFGTANQSTNAFSQPAANPFGGGATAGGGLFGQPPKPSPFSTTATNTTAAGGFGTSNTGFGATSATTSGTGLFGGNTGFGGGQQQASGSNPFGNFGANQQNQNQTNSSPFGGFGSNNNQPKQGGLFGNTNQSNSSGVFGNNQGGNQQQQSGGGLFGNNTTQTASSGTGLFGGNLQNNSGTGLFGNTNQNNSTSGGGLFGGLGGNNNQNQQNQSSSVFGNNNQPKPGGLFGNTGNTGGSLFGNNQQQSGSNLFSNANTGNQQNQAGNPFSNSTSSNTTSSLFGNTQAQQSTLQPPQAMTSSLLEGNPYGSTSIFTGLPPPPQLHTGPLATPISSAQKLKKNTPLPYYKINPASASKLVTPQKRGYGFSYSTYGTPSSVTSNTSTPGGFSSSLLRGSLGRNLGKSLSTSNLRGSFDNGGESLLSPGAFSAGSSRYSGNGSLKKLTIDRSLRTDLFGPPSVPALPGPEKSDQPKQPSTLKKKVSFDASTVGGNEGSGNDNGAEYATTNGSTLEDWMAPNPSAQEQGFLRSSTRANGNFTARMSGAMPPPEMEQVRGNELAIVHEDEATDSSIMPISGPSSGPPEVEPAPGAYYTVPSLEQLKGWSKEQLKQVNNFVIGRENCGRVEFDKPVDLTAVDLDKVYGKYALIDLRSLTVYPEAVLKPARGRGMNVPSTIYLENSWPRGKDRKTPVHDKSGNRFNRHVDRLSKVTGTEFINYDKDTGIWSFRVPHFTTYSFDYDDTASEGDSLHSSVLSAPPDTPTPKTRGARKVQHPLDDTPTQNMLTSISEPSHLSSCPDDTFEFRRKKMFPGAFDSTAAFDDDDEMTEDLRNGDSFLDKRSAVSPSESGDEPSEPHDITNSPEHRSSIVQSDDMDMAGSFPGTGLDGAESVDEEGTFLRKSILQSGRQATPAKLALGAIGDWADELQRTISPRKQDRQTLRSAQAHVMGGGEIDYDATPKKASVKGLPSQNIVTSIDLMNSLFGQEKARRNGRSVEKGPKGRDSKV